MSRGRLPLPVRCEDDEEVVIVQAGSLYGESSLGRTEEVDYAMGRARKRSDLEGRRGREGMGQLMYGTEENKTPLLIRGRTFLSMARMNDAIRCVMRNGVSVNRAAGHFNVPRSTLQRKVQQAREAGIQARFARSHEITSHEGRMSWSDISLVEAYEEWPSNDNFDEDVEEYLKGVRQQERMRSLTQSRLETMREGTARKRGSRGEGTSREVKRERLLEETRGDEYERGCRIGNEEVVVEVTPIFGGEELDIAGECTVDDDDEDQKDSIREWQREFESPPRAMDGNSISPVNASPCKEAERYLKAEESEVQLSTRNEESLGQGVDES